MMPKLPWRALLLEKIMDTVGRRRSNTKIWVYESHREPLVSDYSTFPLVYLTYMLTNLPPFFFCMRVSFSSNDSWKFESHTNYAVFGQRQPKVRKPRPLPVASKLIAWKVGEKQAISIPVENATYMTRAHLQLIMCFDPDLELYPITRKRWAGKKAVFPNSCTGVRSGRLRRTRSRMRNISWSIHWISSWDRGGGQIFIGQHDVR